MRASPHVKPDVTVFQMQMYSNSTQPRRPSSAEHRTMLRNVSMSNFEYWNIGDLESATLDRISLPRTNGLKGARKPPILHISDP